MTKPAPTPAPPRTRVIRCFKHGVPLLLASIGIWIAFRGIEPQRLGEVLRGASIPLLLLSALLQFLACAVKSNKIGVLVRHIKRIRYKDLLVAELVSILVDSILPLRLHEFVRAYIIGRSGRLPPSFIFGSEIVVKVVEALVLSVVLASLSVLIKLPAAVATGIRLVIIAAWVALSGLCVLIRWPRLGQFPLSMLDRIPLRCILRIRQTLENVLHGVLNTAVRPTALFVVMLITIAEWTLIAGALWAAGAALGVRLGPVELLAFLTAGHIAFAIPSSTSCSVGFYEAAGTMALVHFFGMEHEVALGVVLTAHAIMFAVAAIAGIVGLKVAHVTLGEIKREAHDAGDLATGPTLTDTD